jgi:predicted SAM-dependent methyltransferase
MRILINPAIRFRVFLIAVIALLLIAKAREYPYLRYFLQSQTIDRATIRQHFDESSVRKLHLGAGSNIVRGWLNSDIEPQSGAIYLDSTGTYPFPDGSFQYIYAEHLIEHLSWEDGLKMLKECHRVLAPGGKLRIVTPNLRRHFYVVENDKDAEVQKVIKANQLLFEWPETPVAAVYDFNKSVREWGHQFIYEPQALRRTMEMAGFENIRELSIKDKTDPVFEAAEFRKRDEWVDELILVNQFVSMAFEAVR